LKRSFNFEEEEQRNERALTLWVEASDIELATTSGRELCEAATKRPMLLIMAEKHVIMNKK
jgi:hypothetical protein